MMERRCPKTALAAGFLAVVGTAMIAGCGREPSRIDLGTVPLPEGGTVYTVAVLDDADNLDIVAPSAAGLFVHRNDSGPWSRLDPQWPSKLRDGHHDALEALGRPGHPAISENFTAWAGQLWMLTGSPAGQDRHLVTSTDAGHTWTVVDLPRRPVEPDPSEADPSEADPSEPSQPEPSQPEADRPSSTEKNDAPRRPPGPTERPTGPLANTRLANTRLANPRLAKSRLAEGTLRLLNHQDQGLFLARRDSLWRLDIPPNKPDTTKPDPKKTDPDKPDSNESGASPTWTPISLAGVDLTDHDGAVPRVLRHYLPASPARPFEMLTVLGDKLQVYRRGPDNTDWSKTTALPVADRQLVAMPNTETLVLLATDGLFKSTDRGDSWTPISLPRLPQNQQGIAIETIPAGEDSNTSPAVVLISDDSGGVYRSVDVGQHWTEVHPPDSDQQVITHFTRRRRGNRVWAATDGAGVLRSLDRGQTWHPINNQLRATQPYTVELDNNGGLLLGSDAGLFRLLGAPLNGHWQMLQNRPTTVIHVNRDTGTSLDGTATGAIVRLEADGKTTTAEATVFGQHPQVVYQPPVFRGINLAGRAVVDIAAHPDSSRVVAWTAQQGPLMSLDDGVSWRQLRLNPAFEDALNGSYLSNFTADIDQRMYVVTHALDASAPTQLWRSSNNGDTWHAISSFSSDQPRSKIYIRRSDAYPADVLFLAHRDRFAKSVDGGRSWRDLDGPWDDGTILAYRVDAHEHDLLVRRRHTIDLVRVQDDQHDRLSIISYPLEWPAQPQTMHDDLRQIVIEGNHIFATGRSELVAGTLPDNQQKLPNGLAILLTVVSVLTLTLAGFGIVRWNA